MSVSLQIFQSKPNPTGKDKTSSGVPKPEQLLGEWVDIRNTGTEPVSLSTVELHHTLFGDRCETTGRTEAYWRWDTTNELRPAQTIRVFTGRHRDQHLMNPADGGGVDWWGFANRDNFVLNNRCGDAITVPWRDSRGNSYRDTASYRPNSPEGATLRRSGDYLVPSAGYGYGSAVNF